jgi:predicted nucleic acid-binding protein
MRIYLDTCCFNRPFDNQAQHRIQVESQAVLLILDQESQGLVTLVGSEVLASEVSAIQDEERRARVEVLTATASIHVRSTDAIRLRGHELEKLGFGGYDALHIASAEAAPADVLITTDDQMVKRARRMQHHLGVRIVNPLTWVQEQAN